VLFLLVVVFEIIFVTIYHIKIIDLKKNSFMSNSSKKKSIILNLNFFRPFKMHFDFFGVTQFESKTKILLLLMLSASVGFKVNAQDKLLAVKKDLRERLDFNADWRFQKEAPSEAASNLEYKKIKLWLLPSGAAFTKDSARQLMRPAGNLGGEIAFTQPGFDDSAWQQLNLPHDWAIEGPFKQELRGATGKLPWQGVGWYRKTFKLPSTDAGRKISLNIDGAMACSMVWCNGQFVGGWAYGYSSYSLDLTPYIKPGAENTLSIRLNNVDNSSRWYPGSGLYRNVWLVKTNPTHVAQWGTYLTTPEISPNAATVQIITRVESTGKDAVSVGTEIYELDNAGRKSVMPVARLAFKQADPVTRAGEQISRLKIASPKLWSCEKPQRYVAVTKLTQAGKVVDIYETPFGIRTILFTADNGFLLNGKRVYLQGVCNHHDLGALGSAFNVRAAERQLEIMKEMGVNALRTSHNPPAPELLDLCDRMGILVMDESFDCWKKGKWANDYNKFWDDWHEQDLRALIRRDRNHPSIILWSIGNEVNEQGDAIAGPAIAAELTAISHEEDPTRPTVFGANYAVASFNGMQKAVDVMGQNYRAGGYAEFKKKNPTIPLLASETTSCISSRGEYFFETPESHAAFYEERAKKAVAEGKPAPATPPFSPVAENSMLGQSDFQMSSYDLYAPGWASPPDREFKFQDENPFIAGEFVWTGFDYLGEPTPYNNDLTNLLNFHDKAGKAEMERQLKEMGKIKVPSRSSYFGIVDLAGFKKDRFYIYQARWRPEFPMVHILPHWNWPERVGLVTPVHVYTSGDEAELFFNGQSLGRKKKGQYEYRLRWNEVVYQPGELKVIAYKEGKPWAQEIMKTADIAAKVTLQADHTTIASDGRDLSFITVTIADKDGIMVPRSKNLVKFEVAGPGEIVAVDNGDATSFEPFQAHERKAYNGLALVIVRATKPGKIVIKAFSEGLLSAETTVFAK
jgi:beta-galactosidase